MNNTISEIEFEQLLSKYLCNELTPQEATLFQSVKGDFIAEEALQDLAVNWSALEDISNKKTFDAQKPWQQLQEQINQQESDIDHDRMSVFVVSMCRIAAILVIVVSISALLYFWNNSPRNSKNLITVANNESTVAVKTLSDGTTAFIGESSTITYPKKFLKTSRNLLMSGEVFFDVKKAPEQPFIIETTDNFIKVLGTSFRVKAFENNQFQLYVVTGVVEVWNKKNIREKVVVKAGEKVIFAENRFERQAVTPLKPYEKNLRFKDETVADIVKTINNLKGTATQIEDENVAKQKLTVTFNFESNTADEMLEVICRALNLQRKETDGVTTLYKKRG